MRRIFLGVFLIVLATRVAAVEKEMFPGSSDRWHHYQSPNFELYSGNSERESRDLLHSLELVRATFLDTFRLRERRPLPVTVLYFGDERDFRAYHRDNQLRSFYLYRSDRALIVMTPKDDRLLAQRTIFHEYIHHLMRVTEENPLPWYNEGMAELFSTLEEEKDHLLLGRAKPESVALLQRASRLPLEELFAVTNDSPVYREGKHDTGLFYAQSWALVHFCHLGISKLPKDRLELFLRLSRSAKLAEQPGKLREITQQLLGMDYPELNEELGNYMRRGRYNVFELPKPALDDSKTYATRLVPPEEIHSRLADLELRVKRTGRASLALIQAAERDLADPRPHEALGMIARYENNEVVAREHWDKAIAAGSENPAIYHELGQMESKRWFSRFDLYFRLPDDVAVRLRELLHRSIKHAPNQTAAYEMLAWVEATAGEPDVRNVNLVQEHFPMLKEKSRTLLALALVRWHRSDPQAATALLDDLEKVAPDSWTQQGAEVLRAKIEGRKPMRSAPPKSREPGIKMAPIRPPANTYLPKK